MKTVLNNNSWPVTLVGPDKRTHELPPGVPTPVPEDVLARYAGRPDFQTWIDRKQLIIGSDSLTGKEKDVVHETKELEVEVKKKNEARMPGTSKTKAELIKIAKELDIEIDPRSTKNDIAVAIELALGDYEPPPLQPGEPAVPSVSPPPPMEG